MSVSNATTEFSPGMRHRLRRGAAIAGLALVSAALPLAVLASPPENTVNLADCPIGWVWDPVAFNCVPYVDPLLVNPVLGPVGPVGVGGVVGPVGIDPILGPIGPVGVGRR